jgi:Protein of unknown function (DUF1549)/Protein of unknown function (DUF1501)
MIPTPEQVQAFVADRSPDAYEKLVDRLLGSSHYGELQARRWLDLARYPDSTGFENDVTRPDMWRYRGYVINAFNRDKPYDEFVKEQLAGDELDRGDQEGLITLSMLLSGGGLLASPALADTPVDPLAPKPPHFPPKVKSVIWLHQYGAPSALDLYDYKPDLVKFAGQEVPTSFLKGIKTSTQGGVGKLFVSNRTWKQYGESSAWFSDLLPNLAKHADQITGLH